MFDTGFFSLHTALFICANLAVAWYYQKDHAVLKGWFPIKIFHWQYFLLNNCFKCLQQNSFHHHCIWVAADILVADISQNQNLFTWLHVMAKMFVCVCVTQVNWHIKWHPSHNTIAPIGDNYSGMYDTFLKKQTIGCWIGKSICVYDAVFISCRA